MRLHTAPPVQIVPVGPIATATEVEITRGPDSTVVPVSNILPYFNKQELPEPVMKREIIIRAWLSGTTGQDGGRPIVAQNPLFRSNINTGIPGAGIFSGKGRVFIGAVQQLPSGDYRIPWGPADNNTPSEAIVSQTEFEYPSAEDPLFTAIPLIAGNLLSRDPNAQRAPGVKVQDAQRLYQKIIDLVAGYDFHYISF